MSYRPRGTGYIRKPKKPVHDSTTTLQYLPTVWKSDLNAPRSEFRLMLAALSCSILDLGKFTLDHLKPFLLKHEK